MRKKLLITGSTGFLGSNLIKKLIKKKYFIICLVRNKSNFENIKHFTKRRYIKFFNFEKKKLRKVFLDYRIDVAIVSVRCHFCSLLLFNRCVHCRHVKI
jgi:nucleoside-diphosphate-sugar epimerase